MRYCRTAKAKSGDPKEGLLENGIIYQVDELTWYAIRVSPMKEFTAEELLKRQGYAVMCPLFQYRARRSRHAKGKDDFERPLIPGYILVGFSGRPDWYRFFQIGKNARTVTGVVSFNGRAAPIPQRSINWVARMHRTTTIKITNTEKHRACHVQPGDQAEVTEGPLSGFMVTVQATRGDTARVIAKMFDGTAPVEISVDNLLRVA